MYKGDFFHLLVIRNVKPFNVTAVKEVDYQGATREDNLQVVLRVVWDNVMSFWQ